MKLFPAIKAKMGRWEYYLIRMSMREAAKNIGFYHELNPPDESSGEPNLLDDELQRRLDNSRATGLIATYLSRQRDRFFSSLVIAALGGGPKWHTVEITSPTFRDLLAGDSRFGHTFGVLSFDGSERYYALDGQHRLAAIRSLIENTSKSSSGEQPVAPFDFDDEEVSVIIVLPLGEESSAGIRKRYRRLFSDLNRHSKPTSPFENIIMDEDDVIAIITRLLVAEHPLFRTDRPEFNAPRVKIAKGKNLSKTDPHFTTLETLYDVNIELLSSRERAENGWTDRDDPSREKENMKLFTRFRPSDKEIELLSEELSSYWDAIVEVLPILMSPEPLRMRDHAADETEDTQDCVLFLPIVQENIMAKLVREIIDNKSTEQTLTEALYPLSRLIWNAHEPLWRHILLVQRQRRGSQNYYWKVADEDRKKRIELCLKVLRWQLGISNHDSEELTALRNEWKNYLPAALDSEEIEEMWQKILDGKLED